MSVLDGHSHALGFLGSALGVPQIPLGVDSFGWGSCSPAARGAGRGVAFELAMLSKVLDLGEQRPPRPRRHPNHPPARPVLRGGLSSERSVPKPLKSLAV